MKNEENLPCTHAAEYRRKAFHPWTYGWAWWTVCEVKWYRKKTLHDLTYIQSKRADFVSESRMVVEDVSDKAEGMGDGSQEDSFQNADGTSYCIHTWSTVCMHLRHRVGIKLCTYIWTHICTICMTLYLYINIFYHIYDMCKSYIYHICDPTDPGDLMNTSRRLNTIRKIM